MISLMPARKMIWFCFFITYTLVAQPTATLPQTSALTNSGDLSAQMVEGIDRWLSRETERVRTNRAALWRGELSDEFKRSRREQLREMIGAVDERIADPVLQFLGEGERGSEIFRSSGPRGFVAYRVRWPVLEGVFGEGLLLEPLGADGKPAAPIASVLAIPDADQLPEALAGLGAGVAPESQVARHLAESGWRVLIPVLVSRSDEFSGNARLKRFTNQPHREWIYRQAYEMGRHVIGYEVQKMIAGVDALQSFSSNAPGRERIGIIGYGEGGLLALYTAALDARIPATVVSGYFGPREQLWREPIYRNAFGFVREFGDAEVAALIAPRKLIVEHAAAPLIKGPPAARAGRGGAAPGASATFDFSEVENEVQRAAQFAPSSRAGSFIEFVHGSEGADVTFGSRKSLALLAAGLRLTNAISFGSAAKPVTIAATPDSAKRQERVVRELESFTQALFRRSEAPRDARVRKYSGNRNEFLAEASRNREFFWREVMGKIEAPKLTMNPRTRRIYDKAAWSGYEVVLDVYPEVFAWGYLLVPKDLKPGERRPVVVCQHGLEGVPEDTVTDDPKSKGFGPYRAFAARLAERGFIVYAPHNPYRGQDKFRVLQRKANPLGLSLFSFIIAQHEVATDWLASLPFVDPQRIAFYGLSYGGKTAMRVPPVIERYCLSICSADFNEWVQKCVTTESPYSYMFTGEYEMPEWNLGHTFNYAEMASLIVPRPFMVERGHDDGVAPDMWVAYEYAKIRRMYDKLGMEDRTEIEFFNGPHQINGVGTFKFLHRNLNWPQP
jgi:dienelactone hydrolase